MNHQEQCFSHLVSCEEVFLVQKDKGLGGGGGDRIEVYKIMKCVDRMHMHLLIRSWVMRALGFLLELKK